MRAKPWPRKINGKTYWYVQWGGKQIRLGTDKKAAHAKYRDMLKECQIGPGAPKISSKKGHTAHEVIDAYEAWIKDNMAPSSWEVKRYLFMSLRSFLAPTLPATELKPFVLEMFFKTQPKIKSPTTKWDKITVLIRMFNWAIEFKMMTENPLEGMPKPTPRKRQTFVPAERFAELFGNIQTAEFLDFAMVMLESGARAQDMLRFRAEHFRPDMKAFVLSIEDSKGKKRSHVIFLPPRALEIVQRLALQYPEGHLFRNSRGKAWTKDSVNCQMRRLKEKLGMPGLCATTLRHSYATWRLEQGQDVLTVSKLMNHVDTRMVSNTYSHIGESKFLAEKAAELTMPLPDEKGKTNEVA